MSQYLKGPGLIATLLVIFIVVIGVVMWSLDLVAQQRTFAFLLSAELVAFAMLVYLYYAETPREISRRWLATGSVALAVVILLAVAVFPGVTITATLTPVQFSAQIRSASSPLQHGESGSVVFTVTQAGDFYYICQVPDHADVGMYGQVVVNP